MENINQITEAATRESKQMANPTHFISSVAWVIDCVVSSMKDDDGRGVTKFLDECEHGTAYGQEAELANAAALVRHFIEQ